jgi:hypothetical protein
MKPAPEWRQAKGVLIPRHNSKKETDGEFIIMGS